MMIKIFSIIISSFLFAACCTSNKLSGEKQNIPPSVQMKADEFIISKTGEAFFNRNIKPDYEKTVKVKDGYQVVYNFSIPEKEIEAEIKFTTDSLGNINREKEIARIPECVLTPGNCSFNISKEEAIRIAVNSGLEEGVKAWDLRFSWDSNRKKYLWDITSTLRETRGEGFERVSGKTILIDPNNGEIIETNAWQIN